MVSATSVVPSGSALGFFLPSASGHLAAAYYEPTHSRSHPASVLYIHPFGHELFNSRPVMSYLWRRLAAVGVGVLAIDLPGCGDSAGDFSEARWDNWMAAARTGLAWLESESDALVTLCGLRLGAVMALEMAGKSEGRVERVILMEPVICGEEMMTQFLRLRVAFSGLQSRESEKRLNTGELRRRFTAGEAVEIAGYILAPELIAVIDQLDLRAVRYYPAVPVDWIQITPSSSVDEVVELWQLGGAVVRYHPVTCKSYWTYTRANAPFYEQLALALEGVFA